jgi:hypothetical protein
VSLKEKTLSRANQLDSLLAASTDLGLMHQQARGPSFCSANLIRCKDFGLFPSQNKTLSVPHVTMDCGNIPACFLVGCSSPSARSRHGLICQDFIITSWTCEPLRTAVLFLEQNIERSSSDHGLWQHSSMLSCWFLSICGRIRGPPESQTEVYKCK